MVVITKPVYKAIEVHAHSKPGEEVCGLITSDRGTLRVHQLRNISPTPSTHYVADTAEALALIGDEVLVGVYHSHIDMAPYPSPTDIAMWTDPDMVMAIYSVPAEELACYRIIDGEVVDL